MNENTSSYPNSIPIDFGTPEKKKEHTGSALNRKNKGEATSKSRRILIVEDEAIVAETVKEFLEDLGYKVIKVVDSGEEAIQIISSREADLILMDVRLVGKMDGIEAALLIHQALDPVPVVFLTAYIEELRPEVYKLSPQLYRFVTKPYDGHELKKAIRELLK
jgi:CheY-like chemotaxis protein